MKIVKEYTYEYEGDDGNLYEAFAFEPVFPFAPPGMLRKVTVQEWADNDRGDAAPLGEPYPYDWKAESRIEK